MSALRSRLRLEVVALALLVLYPLLPMVETALFQVTGLSIGSQLTIIFIFAILALGLNVVVGSAGLLHLGIAGFFGIGAYVTGILTVKAYPFQLGFPAALTAATLGAGLLGVILGAPTLRLRGDYLALVTLGFGEVVRFAIRNLEEITGGTKGLNPVPPPWDADQAPDWLQAPLGWFGIGSDWGQDYRLFYGLALGILVLVVLLLKNLEKSPLGRSWAALREDELAAACMGINPSRAKLAAFALGAALAGLAGCLYATRLTTTAGPDAFDFSRSTIMLCCVIVGGLGSLRGVLLGVFLLLGFDNVLAPALDGLLQKANINSSGSPFLMFSNWRLCIFGLALILVMRFRPDGLLPARSGLRKAEADPPRPQPSLPNVPYLSQPSARPNKELST